MTKGDRELGMGRPITRRDFIDGVAVTVGAALVRPSGATAAEPAVGAQAPTGAAAAAAQYPPMRYGLRGAHPGSFETAHADRDGRAWENPQDTGETYDLVIVGGGLSGLAAGYFFRKAADPSAKVLILDNHDDFGGHAKRNEFVLNGQTRIVSGGTGYMVRPPTWPQATKDMLKEIGVELKDPTHKTDRTVYSSLGLKPSVFFDKESYGEDRLVVGLSFPRATPELLAKTPLSAQARADALRLWGEKRDYMPEMAPEQKIAQLQKMSYRDYLLNVAKVHPDVLPLVGGVWCLGQDTCSAWFAYYRGAVGFQGLGVKRPPYSPEDPTIRDEDVTFPAGNSDIARMIVRWLIPGTLPPGSMSSIETTRVDYSKLDDPKSPVRIRLSSTAVRVKHASDHKPGLLESDDREVDVTYVRDGKAYRVRGKGCVLACNNAMIPYLCPEMPDKQKQALHMAVRAVNMQTSVFLRDWKSFVKAGVSNVFAPGSFYTTMGLGSPMTFGSYKPAKTPDDPIVVGLSSPSGVLAHEPLVRGLRGGKAMPIGMPLRQQLAALRAGMLATPFEVYERHIRDQMARTLGPSGFDPARDIEAIVVNRWPHGFALSLNSLFDPDFPDDELPYLVGRKQFGRITIANSDASGLDLTQTAFDEADRAVNELLPRHYGYFARI